MIQGNSLIMGESTGPALEAELNTNAGYPMFISMEPPDHSLIRKLLSPLMTPQRIAKLEEYIRQKARDLLATHLTKGSMDFIKDFSGILPVDVISTMSHVPLADQESSRGWADDLIYRDDGQWDLNERKINASFGLAKYFEELAIKLAEKPHRPDDIFNCVLQAGHGEKMTPDNVIGVGIRLTIAGNGTTSKLIGNMAYRLWEHPEKRKLLVANPSLIADAVEETLRFDGSTQLVDRTVMQDLEVRGNKLEKGDRVGLCIIAASRDKDHYENAGTYDVSRGARDHMAFGLGLYSCLGAALAKLEVGVCFE
jgi:cytochrome P450